MESETNPCIVPGCFSPGECLDSRNYTKWATNLEFMEEFPSHPREIWYCSYHARQYLFPLIDKAKGNTEDSLIRAFKREGCW